MVITLKINYDEFEKTMLKPPSVGLFVDSGDIYSMPQLKGLFFSLCLVVQ